MQHNNLKDKHETQDSLIEYAVSNREERIKNMKARYGLLSQVIKTAIDFPIDDNIQSPILGDGDESSYSNSVGIGGSLDEYLPVDDFEGKTPAKLNFGRDYVDEVPDLSALPDKGYPGEDLDAYKIINSEDRITRFWQFNR